LKGQSEIKLPVKPISSEKMKVLSTFLESSLNFLFNNLKKPTQFSTVKKKSVSKFELPEKQFKKTDSYKIASKTHLE